MALIRKMFVTTILIVMSAASAGVASVDTNVWELETPLLETIQTKAEQKMAPCEQLDLHEDIEYRDCLMDAALFALSAREKNDRTKVVFENVFNKIDEAYQVGAALKIAREAIDGLKTEGDVKFKSTYYEILKNLMARIPHDNEEYRQVFELIKKSEIEAPEDVVTDRRLRGFKTAILTEEAEMVLSQKLSKNSVEVSE
jgi:hypothetical protein